MTAVVTRFAPSPTGPLHLGHACAAIVAHDMARAAGGQFLLRIEDIDRLRARPEWEAQILDDLDWLGLQHDDTPMRQSDRMTVYSDALDTLWARGLLYPCGCTRRDIEAALSAPQEGAPLHGPDGLIYPGTCRDLPRDTRAPRPRDQHLRLDLRRITLPVPLCYTETGAGLAGDICTPADGYRDLIGDIVLARRDFGTSYHLSVVLDDAAQGVTHVTRGADLAEATPIHVLLQHLLGLPVPVYHHHRLVRDDQGRRLAKRDDARSLASYRAAGASPQDIRRLTGLAAAD